MQNPAQGVAPALQPHVHLISAHRFPHSATLGIDQAYRYLLDAPSIVKQIAPMSWHYISAPQDGNMWLEWIPLEKNDPAFSSDGYVWGDVEQSYQQNYNGYIIELRMHRVGYRPGHDQVACHARTRYHFISKNPTVNAAPPDPSLWVVHYHAADPNQMVSAAQMPVSPQMQQIIANRRWLEAQGRLDRREFMLHDREHWPTVNVPGQAQQPQYSALAGMQNRYPQQNYSQPGGGPPPAKRQRGPNTSISMPGAADVQHETTIEVEEDTALGDFFDHLTQRDISVARYTQHHRWMEEVFSSPYASSRIVPADLGLGLMGELKGLTDGILEPPDLDFSNQINKPTQPKEAEPFTSLKQAQVEEFGKRVERHLEEGQAEIKRMKEEHAAKMQDWKKMKDLMLAEKRLRFATWEDADEVPVYRLELPAADGFAEHAGKENVGDVVKDVEELLKVKITPRPDATRIARGGLRDRKQPVFDYDQQLGAGSIINGINNEQQQPLSTTTSTPGANGATTATFHEDLADAAQTTGEQMTSKSDLSFGLNSNQPTPNPPHPSQQGNTDVQALEEIPGIDMDDTLMEDMDIDVGDDSLNFDEATHDLGDDPQTAAPSAQPAVQAPGATTLDTTPSAAVPPLSAQASAIPATESAQQLKQAPSEGQLGLTEEVPLPGDAMIGDADDANMFNDDDNTFDGLANIDGTGDDALIDFDGGDLGMDDAFGDALHGMDELENPGGS